MSLYLQEDSLLEKKKLIIKLINLYIDGFISSEELYYLLDNIIFTDISKDKKFANTVFLSDLKNLVNIELAFFTTNKDDLLYGDDLFGEDKFRELILNFKNKHFYNN